jgi:hypothetical protein
MLEANQQDAHLMRLAVELLGRLAELWIDS